MGSNLDFSPHWLWDLSLQFSYLQGEDNIIQLAKLLQ